MHQMGKLKKKEAQMPFEIFSMSCQFCHKVASSCGYLLDTEKNRDVLQQRRFATRSKAGQDKLSKRHQRKKSQFNNAISRQVVLRGTPQYMYG